MVSALGWLLAPPRVSVPDGAGRVVLKLRARDPEDAVPARLSNEALEERRAAREAARLAKEVARAAERAQKLAERARRKAENEAARQARSVAKRSAKRAEYREQREAKLAAVRLARAALKASKARQRAAKPAPARTAIVRALVAKPGQTSAALFKSTGLSYPMVTNAISVMARAGLLNVDYSAWPPVYRVTDAAIRMYGGAA